MPAGSVSQAALLNNTWHSALEPLAAWMADRNYTGVHVDFEEGKTGPVSEALYAYFLSTLAPVMQAKGLLVEVGAVTVCAPALEASLSVCGVSIAEGQGVVMLNMPNAISVDVSSSRSKVTKSGDGAILYPFSIATSVSFDRQSGCDLVDCG